MSRMKSFTMGLLCGLVGHPLPEIPGQSHVFDGESGLLVIARDDGSLEYAFSEEDFSLEVREV